MHQHIHLPEILLGLLRHGLDLLVLRDVAFLHPFATDLLGQRLHPPLQRFARITDPDLRTFAMHGLRDAPGDRPFICQSKDQVRSCLQVNPCSSKKVLILMDSDASPIGNLDD